ncbi:MAG TPA: holo-ACP synthase [Armatimonadota bacterium]|jgi:holo-[acyl-carrier protein] synthase
MALIGTDIEQISRVALIIARTPRFMTKFFTAGERAYCDAKAHPAQHYTARFCAKEAFAKALGVALSWQDVEVVRGEEGPPALHTHGTAAALLAGRPVRLSLSHAGDYAIAMVLIEDL